MGSAHKAECQVVVAELYGAHNFSYRAGRHDSAELIRARLFYVEKILDNLLGEVLSSCTAENVVYSSRGSGRFDLILQNCPHDFGKQIETAVSQFNDFLLDKHAGDLVLVSYMQTVSIAKGPVSIQYARALKSAQTALRAREYEAFKDKLEQLFAYTYDEEEECEFCGREDLPLQQVNLDGFVNSACELCNALIILSRGEAKDASAAEAAFYPPSNANAAKQIQFAEEQLNSFSKLSKQLDEPPEAALHFSFWHNTEQLYLRGARIWDASKRNEICKTFLAECNKIIARSPAQQLFVVEANDDNVIVTGKLAALFELSFAFSELMEKQLPFVPFGTGLAHSARDLPLNWLIADAVKLSEKAREQGSAFMAVNLGGDSKVASGCFSWADWRQHIKPLVDKIRHFDHLGVLGFGFWDYLLDFTRSTSVSIYPLMYRLARREESHSALRRDAGWQKFKTELLMSLSGNTKESAHKRRILKAALACFLLFKTMHSTKQKHLHEPVLLERR